MIMAASTTTPEADTLKEFIPDLVTAICDCVQSVSDQCLAKGLISQTTHERVLESRGTSKEQARILVLSVQNSTKTDEGCFEILLDILNEILPYRVKEKLLSEMRKDLADHSGASMRKALIPASLGTRFVVEDDRLQHVQQQGFLFGKYESSMKKYAHASAEKAVYEESLQNKTKESGRLRSNLDTLRSQSSDVNSQEIDSTVERLSACEMEMTALKERIEKLEGVVQEEDMQARRGKSILMVGTKTFARMTEEQFAVILMEEKEEYKRLSKEREDELRQKMQEEMNTKIALMEKEHYEHKKLMKQQEDELRRKMQEEMNRRDLEHKVALQERDHKMALQEKELRIKELELNKTKMRQETPEVYRHKRPAIDSSLDYKTGYVEIKQGAGPQSSNLPLLGHHSESMPSIALPEVLPGANFQQEFDELIERQKRNYFTQKLSSKSLAPRPDISDLVAIRVPPVYSSAQTLLTANAQGHITKKGKVSTLPHHMDAKQLLMAAGEKNSLSLPSSPQPRSPNRNDLLELMDNKMTSSLIALANATYPVANKSVSLPNNQSEQQPSPQELSSILMESVSAFLPLDESLGSSSGGHGGQVMAPPLTTTSTVGMPTSMAAAAAAYQQSPLGQPGQAMTPQQRQQLSQQQQQQHKPHVQGRQNRSSVPVHPVQQQQRMQSGPGFGSDISEMVGTRASSVNEMGKVRLTPDRDPTEKPLPSLMDTGDPAFYDFMDNIMFRPDGSDYPVHGQPSPTHAHRNSTGAMLTGGGNMMLADQELNWLDLDNHQALGFSQ